MEKLHFEGNRFVGASGHQVLLHGLNVLNRQRPHLYPDLDRALPWFKTSGFNLIRLGIFWDAVEPEPGTIDFTYLDEIKRLVRAAGSQGIYVILDMHQDLFAQKFIDGAPDWACLDEGAYHPDNCNLWYEAYLSSEAIIKAADNFWANAPAEDGVGLLDHYAAMWKEIARVFDDCDNVIGLEPMNEPFMGSLARASFGAATMQMMTKIPTFDLTHPETIDPAAQAEFMDLVSTRFLDWDRTVLMDFYRRIRNAVREVSDKPIVTGGNIYCSTDIPTGLELLEDGLQIYAPHGYDSVVDSDRYDAYNKDNVARLYARKRVDADRLGLPTIVGEWG
ncbi:MAG: glycoside hydrolase family 5 protein, partial [Clostridiales bacterium]|nr:glycoside hydrolase family 5 protein [Clostridiales bacterium]